MCSCASMLLCALPSVPIVLQGNTYLAAACKHVVMLEPCVVDAAGHAV